MLNRLNVWNDIVLTIALMLFLLSCNSIYQDKNEVAKLVLKRNNNFFYHSQFDTGFKELEILEINNVTNEEMSKAIHDKFDTDIQMVQYEISENNKRIMLFNRLKNYVYVPNSRKWIECDSELKVYLIKNAIDSSELLVRNNYYNNYLKHRYTDDKKYYSILCELRKKSSINNRHIWLLVYTDEKYNIIY